MELPFAHLNLRRNPFGELTEAERAALAIVDVSQIAQALSDPNYAVQFVGEKGYGKTTHLLSLRTMFPDAGYVHIPEGETRPVPGGCPVMIDEAQRLTWWQRRKLFPSDVPLVLGTHKDYASSLKRYGRKVETVYVGDGTSTDRIVQLLNTRIEHVRRSAGAIPVVSSATVERLQGIYGGNIRGMLYELYQELQNLREIDQI